MRKQPLAYSLAGVLLATVASSTSAQTQTTDCTRDYFGNLHCTTHQQQGLNWGILQQPQPQTRNQGATGEMLDRLQAQRAARAELEAARQRAAQAQQIADEKSAQAAAEREAVERARAQMQRAGQMIASGDCAGAEQYALTEGNLPLATQVKDYCAK